MQLVYMCCINQHLRGMIRVEIQLMVWKSDLVLYLLESKRINPLIIKFMRQKVSRLRSVSAVPLVTARGHCSAEEE